MAKIFTYNNVASTVHNLKLKSPLNHLSLGAKSYESIKIPGRTGNLLIDDGSFENKVIPVICNLDLRSESNKFQVAKNIKTWLQGHKGYKKLVFDDGVTYDSIVQGEIIFEEIFDSYYQVTINFECMEVAK